MGDSYEIILAQEIERIVSSPYPTQLKHLRDLVCAENCSQVDINRCIAVKSCKINRLATCFLDALVQWPYVLDIVTRLACNICVRDALIEQRPNLIHDVIAQAIKSDTALRARYADAAVALLSLPLGSSTPLPSNVQELFIRLVHRLVKEPSTQAIRSIYLLLKGTSSLLLGLLDRQLLWQFENQMMDLLKMSAKKWHEGGVEPKLPIYCLAIMSIVVSVTNKEQLLVVNHGSWDSQDLLVSTQGSSTHWDAPAMRTYFEDQKRAPRTLQLIVVRVTEDLNVSDGEKNLDDMLEVLQLVNEIIPKFSPALRQSYRITAGDVITKMQKKALASGLDLRLRFLAFCFAVQLCGDEGLLSITVDSIRECLADTKRLAQANYFGDIALVDRLFDVALTNNTMTVLVQGLLEYLITSEPIDILQSRDMMLQVMEKLHTITETDEKISETVADVMAATSTHSRLEEISGRLGDFASMAGPAAQTCLVAARASYSAIVCSMCQFFLQNALRPRYRKYWDRVPAQNMDKVLDILELSSCGKSEKICEHVRTPQHGLDLAFAEEISTPTATNVDWRQAIGDRMEARAHEEQQALLSIFAQACADLETRCATTEAPLRQEIQKREVLEKENDDLTEACKQLEQQLLEHKLRVDGLESESEEKDEALQCANEENDKLNTTIKELHSDLREAIKVSKQEATDLRSAIDAAALEYAATLADKQHLLDDNIRALQEANDSCVRRNEDVARLEQDLDRERAVVTALRDDMQQLRESLADKDLQMSSAVNKASEERTHAQSEFERQLQSMKMELEQQRLAHERRLQEVKTQARQSIEANNASHNEVMERLSAQHGEDVAKLEAQLSASEDQLQGLRQQIEDADGELTEAHQTVQEQQRKIERLEKRYKMKDDEVKAQIKANNEWRSKVLLTMGIPIQPQSSLPVEGQSGAIDTEMDEDPSPPTPASDLDMLARLEQAPRQIGFAEDSRSPVPKRMRKSAKGVPPSSAKPQARFSLESIRPSSRHMPSARTQRQPLNSISSNQIRRMSVPEKAFKSRGVETDEETVLDDETQYDGSDIFTGTQQGQITMDFDGL